MLEYEKQNDWRKNAMEITSKLFSYDKMFTHGQMTIPSGEILQIAELSVIKSGEIAEHIQHCDEITYVVSGKATVTSGDTCFDMTAGQIHFIKKGEYHKIVADENHNFHYYCIGFQLNHNYPDIEVFVNAVMDKNHFVVEDAGNIKTLFGLLLNEFFIRDNESNLMIHFYFCQMLITLYRILSGKARDVLNKTNTSSSNQAVYRTLKYIDRNFIKIASVKEIAKELSYSEYYLSHIFKEKMDMTMKDYLMQKKIMMAAELLKESNMSISEIAEQLQFSSLHSFGLAFKRYMQVSASEFRRIQAKQGAH